MPKILAVIVTFHSQDNVLLQLLRGLAPQVSGGIIINNSISLSLPKATYAPLGFESRQMRTNVGVATALNEGFIWAQQCGADFVVTFDQDSQPAPDMVSCLVAAYESRVASGHKVGAVGPQQVDSRTGQLSPFIAPITLLRRKMIFAKGESLPVDHLITSGCLVPINVWAQTGRFLDELFIDYVDIEWSLRLRHHGYSLYGVRDALLQHTLGDSVTQLFGRTIFGHSPLRHYYMFRNGMYMQKLSHVTVGWKISDGVQLIKKAMLFAITAKPLKLHLKAIFCGLRDGYLGRMQPHHLGANCVGNFNPTPPP